MNAIYHAGFKKAKGDAAIKERKKLLDNFHIGITDMVLQGYRYKEWSGDEHIFPIKIKNIFQLLDENRNIKKLIFTSRTYIIGALGIFYTFLHQQDFPFDELEPDGQHILRGKINYKGRTITLLVPYSPSQRVIKQDLVNFDTLLAMYQFCFRGRF
jgi:hypothetical protein